MEDLRKLLNRNLYDPQKPLYKQSIFHSIKTVSSPVPCTSEKPDPTKQTDPMGKQDTNEKVGLRSWNMLINIRRLIIRQLCFFTSTFLQYCGDILWKPDSDPGHVPEKNVPTKNGPIRKTGPQGVKTLPFLPYHMKYNVKVIHFHIKSREF